MTEGRPDYRELIKSPYDDEPEYPSGWILLPIVALVVGAMAGVMVARSQPDTVAGDTSSPSSTTTEAITAQPLTGFPDGYTPVSEAVAAKVLTSYESEDSTYVVIGGVARGDADREATYMQSFSEFVLQQPDGSVRSWSQSADFDAPGMITVGFPEPLQPGAVVEATPVDVGEPVTIRLFDDAPAEMVVSEPIVLDVDGTEVVIDYFEYDLDEGYAAWHSDPDTPAVVDIVVTLVGTEGLGTGDVLPIRILSFESVAVWLGQDVQGDVPTWSTGGELRLGRAGPFRFDEDLIESITVDVVVTLATNPGTPIEIPIP